MALPATDNFNGSASGDPLPTHNAGWTNMDVGALIYINIVSGDEGVQGNGGSYSFCFWSGDTFAADHYSQAISKGGLCAGVIVRASGTADLYMLDCNDSGGSVTRIYKRTAGGFSLLLDALPTFADGDEMKLEAAGTGTVTLTAYKNGVQIGQTTDSTSPHNSGSAGVMALTTSGVALDDWEGGDIGGGGGGGGGKPAHYYQMLRHYRRQQQLREQRMDRAYRETILRRAA